MRYGIYGGGFNPPHIAHVMSVAYAQAVYDLDTVFVSPCWHHAFAKDDGLLSWEHRAEMCRIAFADFRGVRIPLWEKELGSTYTVDLLEAILPSLPGSPFLIVGSDNKALQSQWRRWDDIEAMLHERDGGVITLKRPGGTPYKTPEWVAPTFPDISSTHIRRVLAGGTTEDLEPWVPARVLAYIRKHGLYGHPKS